MRTHAVGAKSGSALNEREARCRTCSAQRTRKDPRPARSRPVHSRGMRPLGCSRPRAPRRAPNLNTTGAKRKCAAGGAAARAARAGWRSGRRPVNVLHAPAALQAAADAHAAREDDAEQWKHAALSRYCNRAMAPCVALLPQGYGVRLCKFKDRPIGAIGAVNARHFGLPRAIVAR